MIEQTIETAATFKDADGRPEHGFTVIEVCIAILVVTFGLVSIVGVSVYISRANSTSNILSVLTTAGQDQADRLRSAVWSKSSEHPTITLGGSLTSNQPNHFLLTPDTPAGELLIRWHVADGPGATGDIRTITIRVVQSRPGPGLRDGYVVTTTIVKS